MTPIQQLMLGAGGAKKKTYMDDVFSTQVYTGRREAELKAIYLEKHPRASAHLIEDTF